MTNRFSIRESLNALIDPISEMMRWELRRTDIRNFQVDSEWTVDPYSDGYYLHIWNKSYPGHWYHDCIRADGQTILQNWSSADGMVDYFEAQAQASALCALGHVIDLWCQQIPAEVPSGE